MNNIFTAIENLYPQLIKNKKLALAWTIFIVAIGWVAYFIQTYPAERAKFEQFRIDLKETELDYTSAMLVHDVVDPQILEAVQVRIFYLENFNGKYPYDSIEPEIIVEGYQQATDLLSSIVSARGTMMGATFYNQELDVFREGFAQDLTLMENYIDGYEAFYLALMSGDHEEAYSVAINFDSDSALESLAGWYTRLGTFTDMVNTDLQKQSVNVSEKISELFIFKVKQTLTLLMGLYAVVFVPVVIVYGKRTKAKAIKKKNKTKKKKRKKSVK